MATDCDVLVLGAGPAGSATAIALANAGFEVLLVDKKTFPRHKPCGEFLSPQCVPFLDELGLPDLLDRLGAARVAGMRLSTSGADSLGAFRQLPDRPRHGSTGFGVRREVFDHALVQHATARGATFLPGHEFVALARSPEGRVQGALLRTPDGGSRSVRCRHVVAADGVHSPVARELDVQRPIRWLQQMALVAHYRGVQRSPHAQVHLLPGGFYAATTVDDGIYSANLVLPKSSLRQRPEGDWDAFVQRHLASAPELQARLRGAQRLAPWRGTGPMAFTTRRQALPGVVLVGDAAGYVDPLTGEGIYFALFTARAAAAAVVSSLHAPAAAAGARRRYERERAGELGPRLFAARLLQRGLRHPWLVRTFVRTLRRWPRLADLVVTMSGDTIHPRELWRPAFWRAFGASA